MTFPISLSSFTWIRGTLTLYQYEAIILFLIIRTLRYSLPSNTAVSWLNIFTLISTVSFTNIASITNIIIKSPTSQQLATRYRGRYYSSSYYT